MLQGDYVVLASEPVCIVGVDVAAPQQVRGARGAAGGARRGGAIEDLQQVFQQQFTAREARPCGGVGVWKYVETTYQELTRPTSSCWLGTPLADLSCRKCEALRNSPGTQPQHTHAVLQIEKVSMSDCLRQWDMINAGATAGEKEDEFRRHWSLKEVRPRPSSARPAAARAHAARGR